MLLQMNFSRKCQAANVAFKNFASVKTAAVRFLMRTTSKLTDEGLETNAASKWPLFRMKFAVVLNQAFFVAAKRNVANFTLVSRSSLRVPLVVLFERAFAAEAEIANFASEIIFEFF